MLISLILIIAVIGITIFNIVDYFRSDSKNISDTLLGTGVLFLTASFIDVYDVLFSLVAFLNQEKVEFLDIAEKEPNYIFIIIGFGLLVWGTILHLSKKTKLLKIDSYENKKPKIKDLKNIEEIKIDTISLFNELDANTSCSSILFSDLDRKLNDYALSNEKETNAFCGIVSIPILLYIGTRIKEIEFKDFYEYHKDSKLFLKLNRKKKYLMFSEPIVKKTNKKNDEFVLGVGITGKLDVKDLSQFKDISKIIYNLDMDDNWKDNVIFSKKQNSYYVNYIYNCIRELQREYKLKKIHLLLVAQTSFVVELGKLLDDKSCCEIIAYQYDGTKKAYTWGIVINGANAKEYREV